jgi:hypothetical protein
MKSKIVLYTIRDKTKRQNQFVTLYVTNQKEKFILSRVQNNNPNRVAGICI